MVRDWFRVCFAVLLGASGVGVDAAESPAERIDCSDCPRLVEVAAGRFDMGIAPGEEEHEQLAEFFRGRSEPRHTVAVRAFAIGIHEVTRGHFRRFIDATGYRTEGCFVWSAAGFVDRHERSWRDPGFAQDDMHPAVCVSWNDAQAYLKWLSARTGLRYRLPSEAEWEYAARSGADTIRFWGDDPTLACRHANGADRTTAQRAPQAIEAAVHPCVDGHAYTAPVGTFPPNRFGIYDMLGNVAEWTQDCWNPDYTNARSDSLPLSEGECSMRVVRGGAWDEGPAGLRSAYRVGSPTSVRVYGRGFRVARDL